jgi:hypothetical protein
MVYTLYKLVYNGTSNYMRVYCHNDINAKYDASYCNPENTNRLSGRALTLGQACGLIGVALFGTEIPLEGADDY